MTATTTGTRYRKKPVIVEAIQWTGDNADDVQEFCGICGDTGDEVFQPILDIDTGQHHAVLWTVKSRRYCELERGGWAIRESDGSGYYPCTAAVFAATYEPAEVGLAVVDPSDLRAALTANGTLPDAVYDRLCAAAGMAS